MDMIDKIGTLERAKSFFKLNSYLVWICFVILCLFTIISVASLKSNIAETNAQTIKIYEDMRDMIKKEISGVVILTQNGSVVNANKSYVDASSQSAYNYAIKNILITHLVFSNNELTKNFENRIETTGDVLKYQRLMEFQENFFTKGKSGAVDNKDWNYILGQLAQISQSHQIADSVSILDSTIDKYSWDTENQSFEISINVSTKLLFWNDAKGQFDTAQGSYVINASGKIDVANNTVLNPLGITFRTLSLSVPIKKD